MVRINARGRGWLLLALAGWCLVASPATINADEPNAALSHPDVVELERISNGFSVIADQVKSSVVNIRSVSTVSKEIGKLFGADAADLPPVTGTGSGIILDANGHIATNNHVVTDADLVEVSLADGRKFRASLVGIDPRTDLAVIKINASGLSPARFGDSDKVRVGHLVLAIGSPFRLGHSVSHGIISAIGRNDDIDVKIDYKNWLQTDAPINPGNSGGPLINTRGEVVGLSVAIATDSGGHQGVGFAIPSNTVRRITELLKSGQEIVRGYLGVQIWPVDEKVAGFYGLPNVQGVLIEGIGKDTPAAESGLREEDIVLLIDERPVNSREQLQEIVASMLPGTEAAMTVWRNRASSKVNVTIGKQPRDFSLTGSIRDVRPDNLRDEGEEPLGNADLNRDRRTPDEVTFDEDAGDSQYFRELGLHAETVSPKAAKQYRLEPNIQNGVIITRVEPTGEAYASRLRRGQVIVGANNQRIHNIGELRQALLPTTLARGVKLKVRDQEEEFNTFLRLP